MKSILLIFGLLFATNGLAQEPGFSEPVKLKIPASELDEGTIFHLKNINGEVKVSGYNGNEILITGIKTVWRKRGELSQKEIDGVSLGNEKSGNNHFVYINAPGMEVTVNDGRLNYNFRENYSRKRSKNELSYAFDLQLKVPSYLMSNISTINGELLIENIQKGIEASSVNGNVILNEVAGETNASTVNGNIQVLFAERPEKDASFETVNGTIELTAPKNLSAVVTFQSLHGELYTDFDNIEFLPNKIIKTSSKGTKQFKVERTAPVKIGNGGPQLNIQILYGNAYIKQRKS